MAPHTKPSGSGEVLPRLQIYIGEISHHEGRLTMALAFKDKARLFLVPKCSQRKKS